MRDISGRWRAEEQIREQAALLENAQDAILVRDLNDRITYWNRSAERVFGWSVDEIIGKNARELLYSLNPSDFDQAKQIVLGMGEWTGPLILVGKGGREISVASRWTLVKDADGQPKSILIIDTDVTEKRKIEEQLFRAQRMESIGTLTGGIAHDLNNVLSPIAMSVEMLRLKYVDEESRGWLRILQESAERGASMVQQVLSFARGNEGKRIEIQPRHLIVELVKVLRETFPKSIDVQFNLPGDLWTVTADPTQLHQILMNLSVNARDAMPQGGLLKLTADNHFVDENYVRMNKDARIGEFVRIAVSDTGTGIDSGILDRIFDPFFTTKPMGEGTGLGLSTTLTIVKSHGGFLDVDSEIGNGTRMAVYLPASTDSRPGSETEGTVKQLPSGRGELVLLVDDEDSIRQITRSTLETFGYQVLTAADGTEALALFAQHRDKVAVVITDTMMPFMDGVATIRALKKLRPDLKIISASGLASERRMPESVRGSVEVFLTKPYTAEMLLTSLAQVLAN
jgi:PAS domain S-box-containing protein